MKTNLILCAIAIAAKGLSPDYSGVILGELGGPGLSAPPTVMLEEQQKGQCRILGTVIDESSREPISKAKVTVLGTNFSAAAGDDGQYRIEMLPEGIYQIRAEASGFKAKTVNNISFDEKAGTRRIFFSLERAQAPPAEFLEVEKQPAPKPGGIVQPVYPESARKSGLEGTVWVKIWIDEEGVPQKADIIKSDAGDFNQASIDAAMKWRFTPAMLKGKPVAVWVTIPFKYKLNKEPGPNEGPKHK
ncbi:MAG: TonB family protein [Ignavibacteriales bacterium]|nr:TonB family protein [Ignavibacteriales bacterium]